jgi:hypothetical protein
MTCYSEDMALTTSPLRPFANMTPVEVDTLLAPLYLDQYTLTYKIANTKASIAKYAQHLGRRPLFDDYADRLQVELDTTEVKLAIVNAKIAPLDVEYSLRSWTRAFIVPGGHVHRSMYCSTCYPSTQFCWMPSYSGADEAKIVLDAGDRACTVCYPSAPVDRPTVMYTPDERKDMEVQAARRAELEVKRAAKAAKAITAADGSVLKIKLGQFPDTLTTEHAARLKAAEMNWHLVRGNVYGGGTLAEAQVALDTIVDAIAAKHGWTTQATLADLKPSFDRKLKQWRKDGSW